ncbi:MAG TPA: hypothetical protein VNG51_19400 [Ktedonobacteraceae bacterium]|nr:hypothetical protein [Ktedonobacteraceae bacterium]
MAYDKYTYDVTNQAERVELASDGVGAVAGNIQYGQQTSNTTAVQLTATSKALSNGLIVQALAANTAKVYVGDSSVTTSTGFELQAGQACSIAASNQNLVYVIGSNNTDKLCWIGN